VVGAAACGTPQGGSPQEGSPQEGSPSGSGQSCRECLAQCQAICGR
jgi:hypothetical protein